MVEQLAVCILADQRRHLGEHCSRSRRWRVSRLAELRSRAGLIT